MAGLLDQPDVCYLPLLIAILVFLGDKMVAAHPTLRRWGIRAAVVAALAYFIVQFLKEPVLDAGHILVLLMHSLLIGGLGLGVAFILLPVLRFLWITLIVSPTRFFWRLATAVWQALRHRQHSRAARVQRTIQARQQDQAQTDQRRQAERHAEAQRRRTEAKAQLAMRYALLEPRLQGRFPRQIFEQFVQEFLGNDTPADQAAELATRLIDTLEQHLHEDDVHKKKTTLEQLDLWYQDEQQRIDQSSADDSVKRRLHAALNVRHAELADRRMDELEP